MPADLSTALDRIAALEKRSPKPGRDGRDGRNGKDALPASQGDIGPRGLKGEKGDKGEAEKGEQGLRGASAFELSGFTGNTDEWLESLKGEDGQSIKGEDGERGPRGARGPKGSDGDIGPMPRHEWQDTKLRFEIKPDEWGKFVDLQGPKGKAGNDGRAVMGGGGGISTGTSLTPSGVTPGAYTNADITVDINGIVTQAANGASGGAVSTVSVVTANGVSGTVADPTTTPAITLTLGAITPTSVAASGSVTGSNLSGTNTGDQTLGGLGGQPLDATLTALAGANWAANALPVGTGADTVSQVALAVSELLGRGASGNVAPITLGTNLSMTGTTLNAAAGTGTVTEFLFNRANGINGTVTNSTTTPELTLELEDIVPLSVTAVGDVTGANLSGTNTGDQTLGGLGGQPLDATLTALSAANWAANALPIGTGADALSQTAFAANTFPARASTGNLVAKAITDFGLSLVDDADATAARTTLGLGTLATQNGTFSGTSSGTNTGDQTITLTGNVTGSGTGTFAATIANDAVTYAKMQDVSAISRLLGRGSAAGAGDPEEITLGTNLTMTGTTLDAAGGSIGDGDKGDITVSASGATWTIDAGVLSNSKLADMAHWTVKGRFSAGTGVPEDMTAVQTRELLSLTPNLVMNSLVFGAF